MERERRGERREKHNYVKWNPHGLLKPHGWTVDEALESVFCCQMFPLATRGYFAAAAAPLAPEEEVQAAVGGLEGAGPDVGPVDDVVDELHPVEGDPHRAQLSVEAKIVISRFFEKLSYAKFSQ